MADCSVLDDKGDNPRDADKWGQERRIRAELVAWLCTDEQALKHIHPRGIQVYGADITDPLNLSFAKIPFPLMLQHCPVRKDIDLKWAEVSQLDLQGSVVQGIMAEGLVVKCAVYLAAGFTSNGEVRLPGAQIGGVLACSAGTFVNENGAATFADRVDVKGSVFLRNGLTAKGAVRLRGAQIGSNVECDAGTFINEGGYAIRAAGVNVKGSVFLRKGSDTQWEETPFTAKGEVDLDLAQIDGQIDCSGGVFSNSAGYALSASRAIVKSSVFLSEGFKADGRVYLLGTQIGGDLTCDGGDFRKATLDLTDASAATLRDSGLNDPAGPAKDWTVWPPGDKDHYLLLDGFTSGRISSEGQINVKSRLGWLARQPQSPFHPQPYLQLAKALRESGDDKGAQTVLIEMEALSRKGSIWSPVLKYTIGYGYHPGRAIWLIILLSVLGWIVYGTSYHAGTMVPTEEKAYNDFKAGGQLPPHYPAFSPLVYSVENSLPLVKLGPA